MGLHGRFSMSDLQPGATAAATPRRSARNLSRRVVRTGPATPCVSVTLGMIADVARLVEQNLVAGIDERAERDVERLAHADGDEDFVFGPY